MALLRPMSYPTTSRQLRLGTYCERITPMLGYSL